MNDKVEHMTVVKASTITSVRWRGGARKQKGVTLIEVLVYMAIALILIALGGGRIKDALSSQGAQGEVDNIIALISGTKELRGRNGYGNNNTNLVPTLDAMARIPNGIGKTGTGASVALRNAWDGAMTVVSAGGNSFRVTSAAIPKEACIRVAQRISETGLVATTRGGSNAAVSGIITSAVAVSSVCTAATNNLEWVVNG